ncbi:hypothetical protein SteCoe_20234 [Stentor coeruleus]|uniref:Uncharacterized protein n=1 Tax=Stentor coeruleus TaxID=5963 RepID=A0A1R2BS69_9CILI|nr:hypothetical protein SteCoe_20234 [Stentor coeruleus]
MTLRASLKTNTSQAVFERENYCKLRENPSLLTTPADLISMLIKNISCLSTSLNLLNLAINEYHTTTNAKNQEKEEILDLHCISKWSTPEDILHLLAKDPKFASNFGSSEKLIVYEISSESIKEKFNLLEYLESKSFNPSQLILAKLEDYSSAFHTKPSDFFDYFPLSFYKFKAFYSQIAVLFIKSFSDQPLHSFKVKNPYLISKSLKPQNPKIKYLPSFFSYKLAIKSSGPIELIGTITSEKFLTWGETYCSAFESGFKPLLIFYIEDHTKITPPRVAFETMQMVDFLCKDYQQQFPSKRQYTNDYEICRRICEDDKEENYDCEDLERELDKAFYFLQEKVGVRDDCEEGRREQKNERIVEGIVEEDRTSFIVKEDVDDNFEVKYDESSKESGEGKVCDENILKIDEEKVCDENILKIDEVLDNEKDVEETKFKVLNDEKNVEDAKVEVLDNEKNVENAEVEDVLDNEKYVEGTKVEDKIMKPSSKCSNSSSSSGSSTPSRKKSD